MPGLILELELPEVLPICLRSPAVGSSPGCCLAREESPPYSDKSNCEHYKRINWKPYKDSSVGVRLHPKTGSWQANPKPWFGECPSEWFNPTAGSQVIAMCCPSHNWHFKYIVSNVDKSRILRLSNMRTEWYLNRDFPAAFSTVYL